SAEYCFGYKFGQIFRYVYFVGMFLGIIGGLEFVYRFLDFFFALLIISNMIGVFMLHGDVVQLIKEFFNTPGKYYLKDIAEKKGGK
ncbi:MAG: alanine:cation symporter family protein, partial [Emergencia timonensis]